jgi:hypothetical protein
MYLDQDITRRFLVADEVGLGKTLVARGLIAKVIEHLQKQNLKRIDIIYICSNLDIARQNINRLNCTNTEDFVLASRITLLPKQIHDLQNRSVNFVSFTPSTSFDLKSAFGITEERAVLFRILQKEWNLRGAGPVNLLRGPTQNRNFRRAVRDLSLGELDASLRKSFLENVRKRCTKEKAQGNKDIKSRFHDLSKRLANNHRANEDDWTEGRTIVGELRALLAETCLEALEPDFIILDEFQRFKTLLDGQEEASILAQGLFNFADAHSQARVLLLSATPYKMYTLSQESEQDDHFKDFLRTVRFLQNDESKTLEFENLLTGFRSELFHLGHDGAERLTKLKSEIEHQLRKIMVRTERLAISANRDGMLTEMPIKGVTPQPQDLESFVRLQEISELVEHGQTIEFWKSAPYLLNFMDDYELKNSFAEAAEDTTRRSMLKKILLSFPDLLLSWKDIRKYRRVDPQNARLRALVRETVDSGAWQLLWMPPTLAHYELGGLYGQPNTKSFTKRLVFSSWRVVPKAIATLVSYEVERRMTELHVKQISNTKEARNRRKPLLRFAKSGGRLTGMPLFLLVYPSITLAKMCDPVSYAATAQAHGAIPSAEEVLSYFEKRIANLLETMKIPYESSGAADETWYWAFPLMADTRLAPAQTEEWFATKGLDSLWSAQFDGIGEDGKSRWRDHITLASTTIDQFLDGTLTLGPPPKNLAMVLAKACLGSPAMSSLRVLSAIDYDDSLCKFPEARMGAAQIGWTMLRLFNLPEVISLIRGINGEEPFWLRVIEYCIDGGLQAVLDEHVHVLVESLGLQGRPPAEVITGVSKEIVSVLNLRTSSLNVDEVVVDPESRQIDIRNAEMRARFAMRFGQGKERAETGEETTREDLVRSAFNSPFWPFVLATTSVGQEGLDFHPYCHAVVHWNLPSNPVDLEQREGRIHRYKGHAVRKNLAARYGKEVISRGDKCPWRSLFELGKKEQNSSSSDIIPYWVYSIHDGAKIERHVLATPLSKESELVERLKKSLVVYRMVFGQPRQSDLIEYILNNFPAEEVSRLSEQLRIDLSPLAASR